MNDILSEGFPKSAVFLIGLPGSGKSTAARYLEHLGFVSVSAGDCVRSLCRADNISLTRENLSRYGQRLIAERGYAYFAKLLLAQAGHADLVVFEGIRSLEVLTWLKQRIQRTRVILIECDEKARLDRLLIARSEDEASYRKVIAFPMENEIVRMIPLLDDTIHNDSDVGRFYESLKRAVFPLWPIDTNESK